MRFVVTSDMAWLKNFELEMNLPQYKVDFQSNINGKVLKLSGKIINLKEVQIAINEPYMGVGKITLNGKLEKRYGFYSTPRLVSLDILDIFPFIFRH